LSRAHLGALLVLVEGGLHDELAAAVGAELLEHVLEVRGDAAEGAVDGLVLLLVEGLDQVVDLLGAHVELLLAGEQRLALLVEVHVLVERLLVDVRIPGRGGRGGGEGRGRGS
jgi:hypothetical protein